MMYLERKDTEKGLQRTPSLPTWKSLEASFRFHPLFLSNNNKNLIISANVMRYDTHKKLLR